MTIGMIPARLDSKRLPGKALKDICGVPMIVHTCLRAQQALSLDAVYLVTDSEEIKRVCEKYLIKTIMTGPHECGTDRIAEACKDIDCDIVVNIQGDEPLVNPDHIDKIVNEMKGDVAIGVTRYTRTGRTADIKAVLNNAMYIMYCSRSDIPYGGDMLKMCFIVAFRKDFLLSFSSWNQSVCERIEDIEYLRILEHGYKIKSVYLDNAHISVDTEDDLNEVREIMKKQLKE